MGVESGEWAKACPGGLFFPPSPAAPTHPGRRLSNARVGKCIRRSAMRCWRRCPIRIASLQSMGVHIASLPEDTPLSRFYSVRWREMHHHRCAPALSAVCLSDRPARFCAYMIWMYYVWWSALLAPCKTLAVHVRELRPSRHRRL